MGRLIHGGFGPFYRLLQFPDGPVKHFNSCSQFGIACYAHFRQPQTMIKRTFSYPLYIQGSK